MENITLSLQDIYEEFLYNRDIGHEQIMYIIEQQQKQEQEQPKTPEQKQETHEEEKKEEEGEEANSDNSNLTTFLQELDDKKKKVLKERKTIPKFKYNKYSLNDMILHNFNFFKYNSEKLDLRERYRDVNTTELTNITGFANDSVDCIKKILTMPEITSETDPSVDQIKSNEGKEKGNDPHGTEQTETNESDDKKKESDGKSGDSSETVTKDQDAAIKEEKSDDESGDSSETVTKDQPGTVVNAQTTGNEESDANANKNIDEIVRSSKIVTSEQRTEESDDQPKTNDPVAAIEKAIVNPINAQITVNEDSDANVDETGDSSETNEDSDANVDENGKSSSLTKKIEKTTFLDRVQDKELGNKQNDFIVAKKTGTTDVVGGGDAIKHLNKSANNPFLDIEDNKKMIDMACKLTATKCTKKRECDDGKIATLLELSDDKQSALKNFTRRHDKYSSFIKYIYGKYFTLRSNKDKIINDSKNNPSTFATNIVKNICKDKYNNGIPKSLSHGSYGNINLIANFFEEDIFDVETKRIKEALPKNFAEIKKIREKIELLKDYKRDIDNEDDYTMDKDRKELAVRVAESNPKKTLEKEESNLTTEVAKVNVDTFMNLYAGLNLTCLYGYNIFDENIGIHKTIIKNLAIMMAMYEIESLDNHVRIARLNGHKEVADSLEKINLASKDDEDKRVRKKVGATFENYFKLLKQSIMADIKENKYDADGVWMESEGEEKDSAEVKGAKSAAGLVNKEAGKKAEKTAEAAKEKPLTKVDTSEGQEDAKTAKEAKYATDEQSGKMDEALYNQDKDKDTEKKNTDSSNNYYGKYFTDCKDFGKEGGDSTENKMKDLIKRFISKEKEEKSEEKNYIKIIQNCFTFNVIPWHVVKHTIDEMLNNDNDNFPGLFNGLDEIELGNGNNNKTLLDQFFTDAFYWNTYEGEGEIKIDFRVKVITSIVTINDVYKSIRNLYIQNIQNALKSKSKNLSDNDKRFTDKFNSTEGTPMNPIYQKILYDYFYKTYILKEGKGLKYFTKLYVSSSVEGIKIIYEGLENQVIRISKTNGGKFFMHAPGAKKKKETNEQEQQEDTAMEDIGNEAKLYFYDEKDKSFILDMMQKINIEDIDNILSRNESNMGIVYKKRIHELRSILNYFNIFMVAQAGNMKFIGRAYNRLRKQLKDILV